ncbi:unnamed protein product [Brassica napus]|uniref:(rape) hypothetical protein n=1 Tax=Brassica napus TaxID=3708 RepID=A0A816IM93_BRANA|nr:unnamed protein product [Brassica napus]
MNQRFAATGRLFRCTDQTGSFFMIRRRGLQIRLLIRLRDGGNSSAIMSSRRIAISSLFGCLSTRRLMRFASRLKSNQRQRGYFRHKSYSLPKSFYATFDILYVSDNKKILNVAKQI